MTHPLEAIHKYTVSAHGIDDSLQLTHVSLTIEATTENEARQLFEGYLPLLSFEPDDITVMRIGR